MRWLAGSIAWLAIVTWTWTAQARGAAQLRLTSSVDDKSCPDEPALRRMVAAQLGYDPFDVSATMRVEASIERKANRLHGRVKITRDGSPAGVRELDAANDCEVLATALALTISVAIDPMGASRDPRATPPPPPPTPPVEVAPAAPSKDVREVVPPPAEAAPTPTPSKTSLRLTIAPMASVGIAPAVAAGVSASVGARWSSVSVALEGRLDLPASARLSIGGDVSTSVGLALLVPCLHLRRWVGCALGGIGSMRAESTGVTSPGSDSSVLAAAGLRGGFEIPVSGSLAVRPQVDVLAALSRPSLRLNGETIWTAPPVSASLGVALVAQLGGPGPL